MGSGSTPLSVRCSVLVAGVIGLICATPAPGQSVCEVDHVFASDGGGFHNFGKAVAVSGDTSLIGARTAGADTGFAYVFSFDGTRWGETQKLLASDGGTGEFFGWSVAVDGGTLMVGAPGHLHGPGFGAVYVFVHDGSQWVEAQELTASVGELGAVAVSLDGDVAVVGNSADDNNGAQSGSAYIFRFDPDSALWLQEQKLLASDGATGDFFGTSVDVSGDVALIGAHGDNDGTNNTGSAYVFRFDGASWVQEQKLTASDATAQDVFGAAVALGGDLALIGASNDVPGSAYIFELDPKTSQWVEVQKLVASDGDLGDEFGDSVALEGSTALIGAWASDAAGLNQGAAYVFRLVDGTWLEQQRLLPAPGPWTAFFGRGVALSGDVALIGANGEDAQAGGAYMYTGLVGLDYNANGISDACEILDGAATDSNGNGVPDECECPWDCGDGDGEVGIGDFLAVIGTWGQVGVPCDVNGDGVGIDDFLAVLGLWGPCL